MSGQNSIAAVRHSGRQERYCEGRDCSSVVRTKLLHSFRCCSVALKIDAERILVNAASNKERVDAGSCRAGNIMLLQATNLCI